MKLSVATVVGLVAAAVLLIYIRDRPGERLDPIVKEYLQMVLSKRGQAAVSAAPPGYLPLNAREAAEEQKKLE
jgi:phosphate transport system substrate-binding protein